MGIKHAYNEIDPYAAQWLRNLIAAGHLAPGDVLECDIKDIKPDDLKGYVQCHFFAGLGGWPHALRMAGWPDDKPVWTGSCPCQPFSQAGKGGGFADERHLWPYWHHLIAQCRPSVVFGEQVASPDGLGWIDLVQADMEGTDYAFGKSDLCAAGVGAPHIRQRLWFVGHANEQHPAKHALLRGQSQNPVEACGSRASDFVGNSGSEGLPERIGNGRVQRETVGAQSGQASKCRSDIGSLEYDNVERKVPLAGVCKRTQPESDRVVETFWSGAEWLPCTDGKSRPVEPGTLPLAHGVSARVAKLRTIGNAIVRQVATAFIQAYCDAVGLTNDVCTCTVDDMICACGKVESDGKRCRLGATHKPPLPWEVKPVQPEPPKEKLPWET